MFTARNGVLLAVFLLLLVIVSGIASLLGEPDSGGMGIDSYGTRWNGGRATYELLAELGVPVQRQIAPPTSDLPESTTLVFWQPDPELVSVEPAYLTRLLAWVERGGRIIAVPRSSSDPDRQGKRSDMTSGKPVTLLSALELNNVEVDLLPVTSPSSADVSHVLSGRAGRIRRGAEEQWEETWRPRALQWVDARVEGKGSLLPVAARSRSCRLPQDGNAELSGRGLKNASGTLLYTTSGGESYTVAAAFKRGRGEIILLADPTLLFNVGLATADNGVLVYDLLAAGGRTVVFDEFYHGLAVRGNPLFLLTRARYAVGAAIIMLLVGLYVWRQALTLGPPLATRPRSRRTIVEYVEAMARLFQRGEQSRRFVLEETYRGALRTLAERFGLTAVDAEPPQIAAAMARRKPQESTRFLEAVARVEAVQSRGARASESETISALQGICRCL
ncbi:MAG: hypothetical protein C0483_17350 [Pirellula sp.]|nr:hypothetical protein [Pirellula sp.]